MICLGVLEARESQNDRILLVESKKSNRNTNCSALLAFLFLCFFLSLLLTINVLHRFVLFRTEDLHFFLNSIGKPPFVSVSL